MDIKIIGWIFGLITVPVSSLVALLITLIDKIKSKSDKIDTAIGQGRQICYRCDPPRIMLSEDGGWWGCPECGRGKHEEVIAYGGSLETLVPRLLGRPPRGTPRKQNED